LQYIRLNSAVPDLLIYYLITVSWRKIKINITPLYDRVVIKRCEEDKITPGGIVIPDSAAEKPVKGEVIAIGKGKILDNGNLCPLEVKVGDVVLYGKYAGNEIKIGAEKVLVMRENDIMAVLEA